MTALQNDIAGSAVFWTLGESTDYKQLSNALSACGFNKFIPERMTDYAALKAALEHCFPDHEVFPVKGAGTTFELVSVRRDQFDKRNNFQHVLTASVTASLTIETDSSDDAVTARITEQFQLNRNTVPYHNVSRCLVDIVFDLQGTTLRPSGGIYWIPNNNFDRWERVAAAVESAGAKNQAFALRTFLDEHSAAVLRAALSAEIAREARSIDETMHDPDTGLKAAATAKKKARNLRSKIEAYESAFSMALPELKQALDRATCQEATANLLDAASAGPLLLFSMTGS